MRATYNGILKTEILMIIPLLLFVSRSTISGKEKPQAYVYALHITPWLEIGFNRRVK